MPRTSLHYALSLVHSSQSNMPGLHLHELHSAVGARFGTERGAEIVINYGDPASEYLALQEGAAIFDLSFRGRLCITGADRVRFLHGQVTNDIKQLQAGQGAYAALVNAKGRMESDLNVYFLTEELLLDFEPGLTQQVSQRLENYIVADDVQVIDVGTLYGLLSLQGPQAAAAIRNSEIFPQVPQRKHEFKKSMDEKAGELYLMNLPRVGTTGFDVFVPVESLTRIAERLSNAARMAGGRWAGWEALETARIESGIPRFGIDMGNSNFPQECGIEASALSYNKGCYIGQEVLNRIHTLGHVNRELRGLKLAQDLKSLPVKGDKLFLQEKEVGSITSAVSSPKLNQKIALGFVRNEAAAIGTALKLRSGQEESTAHVASLPFDVAPSISTDC